MNLVLCHRLLPNGLVAVAASVSPAFVGRAQAAPPGAWIDV
jgi:hypothetical protein